MSGGQELQTVAAAFQNACWVRSVLICVLMSAGIADKRGSLAGTHAWSCFIAAVLLEHMLEVVSSSMIVTMWIASVHLISLYVCSSILYEIPIHTIDIHVLSRNYTLDSRSVLISQCQTWSHPMATTKSPNSRLMITRIMECTLTEQHTA